jgi:hypothetical protein
LKTLTSKAENAIRFFQEIALKHADSESALDLLSVRESTRRNRGTGELNAFLSANLPGSRSRCFELHEAELRRSRFSRGNCTESKLAETDQYRSKSVHSPRLLDCGLTQQFAPQALTRVGQVTPARGAATLSDFRNETMHS